MLYYPVIRSLLLALCCFLPAAARAQYTVSVRQGASLWLVRSGIGQGTLKYAAGQHFTWDKELSVRKKLNGKWACALSLANYQFRNTGYTRKSGEPFSERNVVFQSNLSLQYDVTYPLLGYMFYSMQNMRAYVGFEVSPALSFNRVGQEDGNGKTDRSTTFSTMLGFTYTHIVPVSKRLSVVSRLAFRTNSFSKYQSLTGEPRPNKSIGWHTGIGYAL